MQQLTRVLVILSIAFALGVVVLVAVVGQTLHHFHGTLFKIRPTLVDVLDVVMTVLHLLHIDSGSIGQTQGNLQRRFIHFTALMKKEFVS